MEDDIDVPSCIFFDSFNSLANHNNNGTFYGVNVSINTVLNFQVILGQPSSKVEGVKDISLDGGIHGQFNELCFITFQHESLRKGNGSDSSIYGYWLPLRTKNTIHYYGIRYDTTLERLYPYTISGNREQLVKRYVDTIRNMIPYATSLELQTKHKRWGTLVEKIDCKLLGKILASSGLNYAYYVDSETSSVEEVEKLDFLINKDKKIGESHSSQDSQHLVHYTSIKFKSLDALRPNMKMIDYLDKSYYLDKLSGNGSKDENLVGELQLSFMHMYALGNYGSALQWHNLVELFQCSSNLNKYINIDEFYQLLETQLSVLPLEYKEQFINKDAWERMSNVKIHSSAEDKHFKEIVEKYISNMTVDDKANDDNDNDNDNDNQRLEEIDENDFSLKSHEHDSPEQEFVYINHTSSEDSDSDEDNNGYTVANRVVYRKV